MARKDASDKMLGVELQLEGERASALGHAGRALELCLDRLSRLEAEARALSGAARATKAAEHAEERKRAEYLRWCLEVQREAMGLRVHTDLDAWYRIPPPLTS